MRVVPSSSFEWVVKVQAQIFAHAAITIAVLCQIANQVSCVANEMAMEHSNQRVTGVHYQLIGTAVSKQCAVAARETREG